jgi:hypothetical protein
MVKKILSCFLKNYLSYVPGVKGFISRDISLVHGEWLGISLLKYKLSMNITT